ncbi:Putative polyphenol oxidase (tyrosinase) [Azospirillum lipoferum 4B]|uniref:Polyphenol oxidase (Tyrosinase) n=1 Tax=Azospirillum lipoferum (strain 4B) TaxID=862719 RepID=G7Z6L5_AZOL4|nr:Putative polyphenol oxidase (tyrosinase) [Azospirillum lipoferum 4B]
MASGAAVAGLAAVGTPIRLAQAATANRPNIATPAGQAMIAIYEQAVKAMKDPAINNPPQPQSWTFQAYIHSLPYDPQDPNSDGYVNGSASFKAKIDQIYGKNPTGAAASWKKAALACWSTCPHGSPYFLPWHRWYMYYFEQIIRSVSKQPDFALPYWDYGASTSKYLQLPPQFQDPASALYEAIRGNGFTDPLNLVSQTQPMNKNGYLGFPLVDYSGSLVAAAYYPADVGSPLVFPPSAGWYGYGYTGRTETQPHDNVHDGVGGLMGNVPTAAHDPIFYMHHCQIDHLWASWQSYPGNDTINFAPPGQGTAAQPSKADWDAKVFSFVDGMGRLVTATAQGALNYKALGYGYDSLAPKPGDSAVMASTPKSAPVAALASAGATASMIPVSTVAASQNVAVGGGGTTLTLTPVPQANLQGTARATASPATPETLVLKGLTVQKRPPAPLYVFVNLPAGTTAAVGGDYYAGPINLFKVGTVGAAGGNAAGAGGTGHAGHGAGHGMDTASFVYDVSKLLETQRQKGIWSGGPVTVTITTIGQQPGAGTTYVNIGSVELKD